MHAHDQKYFTFSCKKMSMSFGKQNDMDTGLSVLKLLNYGATFNSVFTEGSRL